LSFNLQYSIFIKNFSIIIIIFIILLYLNIILTWTITCVLYFIPNPQRSSNFFLLHISLFLFPITIANCCTLLYFVDKIYALLWAQKPFFAVFIVPSLSILHPISFTFVKSLPSFFFLFHLKTCCSPLLAWISFCSAFF